MALLASDEQAPEFIFQEDYMERIQPIGIAPRMGRVGSAIPIAAALASAENLEHPAKYGGQIMNVKF